MGYIPSFAVADVSPDFACTTVNGMTPEAGSSGHAYHACHAPSEHLPGKRDDADPLDPDGIVLQMDAGDRESGERLDPKQAAQVLMRAVVAWPF